MANSIRDMLAIIVLGLEFFPPVLMQQIIQLQSDSFLGIRPAIRFTALGYIQNSKLYGVLYTLTMTCKSRKVMNTSCGPRNGGTLQVYTLDA
jgi:hypothetical protein